MRNMFYLMNTYSKIIIYTLLFLVITSCTIKSNKTLPESTDQDTLIYVEYDEDNNLEFQGYYFKKDTSFFKTKSHNHGKLSNIVYYVDEETSIGVSYNEYGDIDCIIKVKEGEGFKTIFGE